MHFTSRATEQQKSGRAFDGVVNMNGFLPPPPPHHQYGWWAPPPMAPQQGPQGPPQFVPPPPMPLPNNINNFDSMHSNDLNEGWVTTVQHHCRAAFLDVLNEVADGQVESRVSPEFQSLDHRWRLDFDDLEDDDVSMVLRHLSKGDIAVMFNLCVIDCEGILLMRSKPKLFVAAGKTPYEHTSNYLGVKWSKVHEAIRKGGPITVEIRMKLAETSTSSAVSPFIPTNPSACKVIQNLFMDKESADIVFEVSGSTGKKSSRKIARTEPAMFYAHRFIIQHCSTTLAEICESVVDQTRPIQVTDVSPSSFHRLLNYIYGGRVSTGYLKKNAKEIIDASDRYGIPYLKLEAEACLVEMTVFSEENVLDLLLYAESKNCALLKEVVMDFIVEKRVDVLKQVSFKDAPGSMISDVLAAVARRYNVGLVEDSEGDYSTLRISDLRQRAHKKGLDVDGSREMLIAALEESS